MAEGAEPTPVNTRGVVTNLGQKKELNKNTHSKFFPQISLRLIGFCFLAGRPILDLPKTPLFWVIALGLEVRERGREWRAEGWGRRVVGGGFLLAGGGCWEERRWRKWCYVNLD